MHYFVYLSLWFTCYLLRFTTSKNKSWTYLLLLFFFLTAVAKVMAAFAAASSSVWSFFTWHREDWGWFHSLPLRYFYLPHHRLSGLSHPFSPGCAQRTHRFMRRRAHTMAHWTYRTSRRHTRLTALDASRVHTAYALCSQKTYVMEQVVAQLGTNIRKLKPLNWPPRRDFQQTPSPTRTSPSHRHWCHGQLIAHLLSQASASLSMLGQTVTRHLGQVPFLPTVQSTDREHCHLATRGSEEKKASTLLLPRDWYPAHYHARTLSITGPDEEIKTRTFEIENKQVRIIVHNGYHKNRFAKHSTTGRAKLSLLTWKDQTICNWNNRKENVPT